MSAVDELERQLREAVAQLATAADGRPRRWWARLFRRRGGWMVVPAALVAVVGVSAAAILAGQPSLSPPHVRDLPPEAQPLAGSVRLASLNAPDPGGGAPWDIRLSRSRSGETCSAVGQVVGGRFGIVGLDGVFRVLPLGGVDACSVPGLAGPVLAGARVAVGRDSASTRTVVNGVAGPGARSVTAWGPDGPRPLRLGPGGSFITVYAGYVEDVRPRVVIIDRNGTRHETAFAQSAAFETSDPAGGAPWQVSGGPALQPGAYPDEDCAQATREAGRGGASGALPPPFDTSLTPNACGRLGQVPLFVVMRRFVPGAASQSLPGETTAWGNHPARTLVYGAAAPRVRTLTLSGAGPDRSLPIDPRGGVFLAVLDGRVDPRSLTLTAVLRDRQRLRFTRSTNVLDETGRPVIEPPVAPYSEPLPASKATPPPFEDPITSTVRQAAGQLDLVGGPAWVLRSWQGRPDRRTAFMGPAPERFLCWQAGVTQDGHLVQPVPGGHPIALAVTGAEGQGSGLCNDPGSLARYGPTVEVVTYPDDPAAYAPRPLRTVLSGLIPPGTSDPLLLGAGAPRHLTADANHAFLIVLPGRYWNAPLRVEVRQPNGHFQMSRGDPVVPDPRPSAPGARAPDPDGGAPWALSVAGGTGASQCEQIGRVVENRLARIDPASGQLRAGPSAFACGRLTQPGNRNYAAGTVGPGRASGQPLSFFNQDPYGGQALDALSAAQIERRTLPGRTIIAGIAAPNVVSITLSTPRDVRTLRPEGSRHLFISVYDGTFYRGVVSATVLTRDRRVLTIPVQVGPPGSSSASPSAPTLAVLLRDTERQLGSTRRSVGPHQARPSVGIRRATAVLERIVSLLKHRIAYIGTHPGILPAD